MKEKYNMLKTIRFTFIKYKKKREFRLIEAESAAGRIESCRGSQLLKKNNLWNQTVYITQEHHVNTPDISFFSFFQMLMKIGL